MDKLRRPAIPALTLAPLALLAILALSIACETSSRKELADKVELSVFAASSLTEAFEAIARGFERTHPGVDVQLTFAGSQVLRLQVEQGASADLLASANKGHMQTLINDGHVSSSRVFARNELVVIVPKRNPANIKSFKELKQASRIVIGADNVPIGIYTRRVFDNARAQLGGSFEAAVQDRIVSQESNARLVRAKVELGEADAAVVYRTDAVASDAVKMVPIPDPLNVQVSYHFGVVERSEHIDQAKQFMAYILSAEGRKTLARHGFVTETE